jgi:hypothetical protein
MDSGVVTTSRRLNESFFQNLAAAIRALRRVFQNVIRHAGIGAGNAVKDVIEWDFGTFRITVLAGFDQPLGFVQGCSVDEDDVLLFGSWVEEVARHLLSTTFLGETFDVPIRRSLNDTNINETLPMELVD